MWSDMVIPIQDRRGILRRGLPVLSDVVRLLEALATKITGIIPLICVPQFVFPQAHFCYCAEIAHVTSTREIEHIIYIYYII